MFLVRIQAGQPFDSGRSAALACPERVEGLMAALRAGPGRMAPSERSESRGLDG